MRLLLLGGLLGTGCSDYTLAPSVEEDHFVQRPDQRVDWLFVVDDSCSMGPHQERLSAHFDTLMAELVRVDVDLHVGVVTTNVQLERGRLRGEVLNPSRSDAAARFADAVQVSTEGSGFEMGLEASLLAVTEPNRSGTNAAFLRPGAHLAVLYVSDEEDQSPRPVFDVLGGIRAAVGPSRDAMTAHALVVHDIETCPVEDFEGSVGGRYLAMVEQTGGVSVDLCEEELAGPLTDLSREVSGVHAQFALSGWPALGTLEVTVDGEAQPCGGMWSLGAGPAGAARLVFSEAPPVGTEIVARYQKGLALELSCD